jgi:hypothetical protein
VSRVVWKFPLPSPDCSVPFPMGAYVVSADVEDDGQIVVWALCDPAARADERRVRTVATGEEFDAGGLRYVDTVVVRDESGKRLVWHVFEEPEF